MCVCVGVCAAEDAGAELSPSVDSLHEMKAEAVKVEGKNMLNISWTIKVDGRRQRFFQLIFKPSTVGCWVE